MEKYILYLFFCPFVLYWKQRWRDTRMKDIYLTNYSVNGIKTLDKTVSLSFYKKTINKEPDTQEYNIKGIYGMNGSGKSGIVTSVEILRNLIIDT